MTVRVDTALWKQFDQAAGRKGQTPEQAILEFMREYAALNPSGAASGGLGFDFANDGRPKETMDLFGMPAAETEDQIDLEDYLKR